MSESGNKGQGELTHDEELYVPKRKGGEEGGRGRYLSRERNDVKGERGEEKWKRRDGLNGNVLSRGDEMKMGESGGMRQMSCVRSKAKKNE